MMKLGPSSQQLDQHRRPMEPNKRMSYDSVLFCMLVLWSSITPICCEKNAWQKLPSTLYIQSRRFLNFNSVFGSATRAPPYDRIAGHPVFQVTTPWGSPYLNMERRMDDEVVKTDEATTSENLVDDMSEVRSVALFFLDPDDALAVHGEMSQMDQLKSSDIRITCSSLAKALRQASNLGNGLLTGFPPDPLTGKIKSVQEGGSLRYKIVPPKRQLYYAARCKGRERVGLFGENAYEDAQAAVIGNSALEQLNLSRRREKRDRKSKQRSVLGGINSHMEGYCGIPLFYAPDMERKVPFLKKLVSGVPRETPLFFNYEDLEDAWSTMRKRAKESIIPERPPVEVFNLWDVVSSIERDYWNKKQTASFKDTALKEVRNRFTRPSDTPDLDSITFIPSSRSVHYKEHITARGNGKARLRPMR